MLLFLILALTCIQEGSLMITTSKSPFPKPILASDQALHVARLDAEIAYGDLSGYRVTVILESDGWHIDYELKDSTLEGGGPHYVIDPSRGDILSKRLSSRVGAS
jgi:hypothetical protein